MTTEPIRHAIYIAAPPERIWSALTEPSATRHWLFGRAIEADWQAGGPFRILLPNGKVERDGRIVALDAPRSLDVALMPASGSTAGSVLRFAITPFGGVARLDFEEEHETGVPPAFVEGARRGWPLMLSVLKSLIETGRMPEVDLIAILNEGED